MPDFQQWFLFADCDRDGKITGAEAIPFFTKFANLAKADLVETWEIADAKKLGYLDLSSFIVAMGVVSLKQAGVKEITKAHVQLLMKGETRGLPDPVLKDGEVVGDEAMKGLTTTTTTTMNDNRNKNEESVNVRPIISDDIFAAYDEPQQQQQPNFGVQSTSEGGGGGGMAGYSSRTQSFDGFGEDVFGGGGFNSNNNNANDGFTATTTINERQQQLPATINVVAPQQIAFQWPAMGPTDFQRYQMQFLEKTNNDPNASIPAQICAPLIAASGLEKHVLKQVWEIADSRKIGALAWAEFVVAMYLADVIKTRNVQCPQVMPSLPFPPFDQNAMGLLLKNTPVLPLPHFPNAVGANFQQQQQQQQQQPNFGVQAPVMQQDTFNFITGSQLRNEYDAQGLSRSGENAQNTSSSDSSSFSFRGPQLDLSAVPDSERQFAETQFNNAKQADENLFSQQTRESEHKMSAKAAQEALGNLALFRRKCEANLAEAENRASVAENEARELKKKVEEAKNMCEDLMKKSEASGNNSTQKRLEAAREERNELLRKLEEENQKIRELGGNNNAAASNNSAEIEYEIGNLQKDIEKLRNDIALAQRRLELANERSDLVAQLATVSIAADENEKRLQQQQRQQQQYQPPPAMTPNGTWEGLKIPPLPPMPTPAPATPPGPGFDQLNDWNTTKTPTKQQQQQQLQDFFQTSPPVVPPQLTTSAAKSINKEKPAQFSTIMAPSTDSFDFSAQATREFVPPAVAAALYSQASSGGFFSDDETTPSHSRNPSGILDAGYNNNTIVAPLNQQQVQRQQQQQQRTRTTPENFIDPFADDKDDDTDDSFDDPFA